MENLKIWPVALIPQEGELFSSWLTRMAYAHYQKVFTFYRDVTPNKIRIWNSSVDSGVNLTFLQAVSERANVPLERVLETTLKSYGGFLFLDKKFNGHTRWILSLGAQIKSRRAGLMFCPVCLIKDGDIPYFRKKWRLALSFCCPDCGVWLKENCDKCKRPIWFYRQEQGKKEQMPYGAITLCFHCGFDIRKSRVKKADALMIERQKMLYACLENGYLPAHNYSHLYFDGIYQIVRVLNSESSKSDGLRKEICNRTDVKYTYKKTYKFELFEEKGLKQRIALIKMLFELLDNWPLNFIEICNRSQTWITSLFIGVKHTEKIPYWYASIVKFHLTNRVGNPNKSLNNSWLQKQKRLKKLSLI